MEFRKILVPVNGTEADQEAIKLACALARKTKARIWAVHIIEVQRQLPLDAEVEVQIDTGERILDHIEVAAKEQDYELETDLLQAREVGPAIVDEASEQGVDLILMGVTYKKHFGEFSLGSVIPYVLKNAPCRVILYHQPID